MGRKIKSIVCLLIVMVLIYLQQSVIYAEEHPSMNVTTDSGESQEEHTPDGQNPETGRAKEQETDKQEKKEQDEADEEEKIEKNKENKEEIDEEREEDRHDEKQTDPEIRKYQAEIPEPDGRQGYYVTIPKMEITHVSEAGATVCELWSGEELLWQAILQESGETITLDTEQFREGVQRLDLYMLDSDGKRIEAYDYSREIMIDTQAPQIQVTAERGFDAWYQKEAWIHIDSTDSPEGSQIESVMCYCGNQIVGRSDREQTDVLITQNSRSGNGAGITVVVRDKAGNKSESYHKIYIDSVPPDISLSGASDYMITSQPVTITARMADDNRLTDCKAQATWEQPGGNVQTISEGEWQLAERDGVQVQTFSEDGIYRLQLHAVDASGLVSDSKLQFMIDQTDPVVRYVDELNGQYLQKFRWNYPAEAYIQDFTSFTYQILLDGVLYPVGQSVDTEGRHILQVDVIDAAGNHAGAQAGFVVDHTAPEICFQEIEEGAVYEKEKKLELRLGEKTDRFTRIRINGEEQKFGRTDRVWTFTATEPDTYYIDVEAVDAAGNKSSKNIWFELIPEKSVLEKAVEPMKHFLRRSGKSEHQSALTTHSKTENPDQKNTGYGSRILRMVIRILILAVMILTVMILFIKWRMPGIRIWQIPARIMKKFIQNVFNNISSMY